MPVGQKIMVGFGNYNLEFVVYFIQAKDFLLLTCGSITHTKREKS